MPQGGETAPALAAEAGRARLPGQKAGGDGIVERLPAIVAQQGVQKAGEAGAGEKAAQGLFVQCLEFNDDFSLMAGHGIPQRRLFPERRAREAEA